MNRRSPLGRVNQWGDRRELLLLRGRSSSSHPQAHTVESTQVSSGQQSRSSSPVVASAAHRKVAARRHVFCQSTMSSPEAGPSSSPRWAPAAVTSGSAVASDSVYRFETLPEELLESVMSCMDPLEWPKFGRVSRRTLALFG